MLRRIITIDEEACNGCGLCVDACHEGAIGLIDGKAHLLRDDYCDGLGNCLPSCPTGAITFEEREAAAYDEEAVIANLVAQGKPIPEDMLQGGTATTTGATKQDSQETSAAAKSEAAMPTGGCPGSRARAISRTAQSAGDTTQAAVPSQGAIAQESQLAQWPVQIKLVPINAPYFDGAKLLIAADCCAYAHAAFHDRYMKNHITIIGCPKLDEGDYSEKLTEILRQNNIKSVTVARMEVPCCGGLEHAVKTALINSGKMIPWQVVTIGTDGSILEE